MSDCSNCEKENNECINCETQINTGGVYQRRWEALKKFMKNQAYHNNQIANCALFAMKQIERNIN